MAFIVVYDANVLYPNTLRDLLIRISQAGLVQAKWTNEILDEMLRALSRNRPDIPPDKLDRLRQLMIGAVRDCLVSGYEPLIEGLKLPDPGDRHVLAAAIKTGAQVIVTSNLKHFPAADLRPWDVEAKSPDDFALDQVGIDGRTVAACVQQVADSRSRPPQDTEGRTQPARTRRPGRIHRRPPRRIATSGGPRSTSTPMPITSLTR
jgi:predicted nucleic acid-binding protein